MTQTVGGYLLIRRLGSGGSGTVWEAQDEAGNSYALKLLHPAVAASEESRSRLVREARLVNQIPGDGIARVIDFEADSAEPFVVTELIEGPTLDTIIKEEPLTVAEAHFLATQLQDILSRVHAAGVVHRDLKPSNIIVSDHGPVLIDFGIAQTEAMERITQTGVVNGTPGYVSPELLREVHTPDFSQWRIGDWWAWSALLLSAMTGEPPFGRGDPNGVLSREFQGEPFTNPLPPELATTMRAALHPDPRVRLTPSQVLESLSSFTISERNPAPPGGAVWPVLAVLLGALAFLPAIFGLAGFISVLIPLLAISTFGECRKRMQSHLAVRIIAFPLDLVTAALRLAPGIAISGAVFWLLRLSDWIVFTPFNAWIGSLLALVMTVSLPIAAQFRQGFSALYIRVLPTAAFRWIFTLIGVAAIMCGALFLY